MSFLRVRIRRVMLHLLLGLLMCAGLGSAILVVHHSVALAATTRAVLPVQATPTSFPAGRRTNVTVTVHIGTTDGPVTLILQRLSVNGTVSQLGQLHDDGMSGDAARGDGTYTLVVPFDESSAGEISLRVAAQAGSQPAAGTIMAQRQVYSDVVKISVTPNQNAGNSGSNGNSAGSALGQIIGGIISGLNNHPKEPQQPPPPSRDIPLVAKGLSLRYPPDWIFDTKTLQLNGPINIRNFDAYQGGGIVPPGGAEVDITRVPLGTGTMAAVLQSDLGSVQTSSFKVADHSAIRAAYHDDFSPQLAYDNIVVYVPNGDLLYKFFLSYRAGDPQSEKFRESFEHILGSVKFTD